jgi:aspartate aminotransferase-like enzyme
MLKKNFLLTPGPTPVPEKILAKMAEPIIHHRTPQFSAILKEVFEGLRYVFKTKNDIFIFASSGTGAMEAAVSNVFSAKDKVLVVSGGKFGERWVEIAKAYGLEVMTLSVPYGEEVSAKEVEKALQQDKTIKGVLATLCETSTGVQTDIRTIAGYTKTHEAVLIVDAISALGSCELDTDGWGVDVVVAGSQKGLMIPPGLGFISVSEKAWKKVKTSNIPKYYFDFNKYKKAAEKTDTPYTPAISLIIGLREALAMIRAEGLDAVMARHKKLAEATRQAVKALGLELFAKSGHSESITSVKVPQGVDGGALVKKMRDEYGVVIAGGQGDMKGKVFRIAHMGYMNEFDCVVGIAALECALLSLGYKTAAGKGVAKAIELLSKA